MNQNHISFESYLIGKPDIQSQLLLELIKAVKEFDEYVKKLAITYSETFNHKDLVSLLENNRKLKLYDAQLGEIIEDYKRNRRGEEKSKPDIYMTVYTFSSN